MKPDCRDGKHASCSGDGWDVELDNVIDCPCACHAPGPSASLTAVLEDLWDAGNCTGLDGWVGPGRGAGEVDDYALSTRRRDVEKALAALSAAGFGPVEETAAPEVRYATLTNGETELDEVLARNASVHLEAMDTNHWWLLVTAGGKSVHVNFYTKRAKISGHAEVEDAEP